MSATIVEAVVKLATKVKGEAVKPANATIAAALDTLADALAGENVQAKPTIASAIDVITENYTPGGGGGGVDVGAPTFVVKSSDAPEVDDRIPNNAAIAGLAIGDATIVPVLPNGHVLAAASGMTATTTPDMELEPTTCDAYVVTVTSGVITAAAPWDGTLTPGTYKTYSIWSFTVPALTIDATTFSGQALYLYMH